MTLFEELLLITFCMFFVSDTVIYVCLVKHLRAAEKNTSYWRDQAVKMNAELKAREELKDYDKLKLNSSLGFHYFYNAIMHIKDIPDWETNPDLVKAVENYEIYLRGNK